MFIDTKEYKKIVNDLVKEFPEVSRKEIRKQVDTYLGEQYLKQVNKLIKKSL